MSQQRLDKPDTSFAAAIDILGHDSYTAQRLKHADAGHLHLTARRCFIGPIPEGWLRSHRKEWYKHYLHIHHSSKAPSFSAASDVGVQRRMTGLDDPTDSTTTGIPNTDGAAKSTRIGAYHDEAEQRREAEVEEDDGQDKAHTSTPPAVALPRSGHHGSGEILREHAPADSHGPISDMDPSTAEQLDTRLKSGKGKARSSDAPHMRRGTSATSWRTARETMTDVDPQAMEEAESPFQENGNGLQVVRSRNTDQGSQSVRTSAAFPSSINGANPTSPTLSGQVGSTTSLLPVDKHDLDRPLTLGEPTQPVNKAEHGIAMPAPVAAPAKSPTTRDPSAHPKVAFSLPDVKSRKAELQVRARIAQVGFTTRGRIMTRGRLADGEIVKLEKMLLRVDSTTGSIQPDADFTEKDSQRIETRVVEKWREYMVVCRECDDENTALKLQLYQSRVIPATNHSRQSKKPQYEMLLNSSNVRVSLYSSLDKTIAICIPDRQRTKIFFLRTRSGTSAVEWYHFLRQVMGLGRAKSVEISIPDLNVSVRLDNPFDKMVDDEDLDAAARGDETVLMRSVQSESMVAKNIIDRCLQMLDDGQEWRAILENWANHDHIGLAWRRYDRLEWVQGEHEKKMYGANAMLRTHELELRTKQHYPTAARSKKGKSLQEPAPVEGFLVRLTSQKGVHQKMGKFFFKRLYFTTQSQFLVFLQPSKARPPPPPKLPMTAKSSIPSASQVAGKIPLIFAVNPFPVKDGNVTWLTEEESPAGVTRHDQDAEDEAARNIEVMHQCEGFIDLCKITKVRNFTLEAEDDEGDVEEGSDVDFDAEPTTSARIDGKTDEVDSDRTFELLLQNGLVVRLQAYNAATKAEWIKRLRALVKYWKHRSSSDMELFRSVRAENLKALNIDERGEAYFGQFAQKWEVSKSFASPELYNLCGLSSCRTVHNAGILYRKPRIHATFSRCYVILCQNQLLIFRDTVRARTGRKTPHIHHDRIASVDLRSCYLYSGLMTESDLLYQNRTFDSDAPGSHALPRVFPNDGWTSTDEDAMTTFVLWHGQRKGWFLRSKDGAAVQEGDPDAGSGIGSRLRRVNQLGVKGRSVVFKARSRAERDHWVLAIAAEIERAAKVDEGVRVVREEK